MADVAERESGPGEPGQGEPAPELELDHPVAFPGQIVHFRFRGPAGGTAVVRIDTIADLHEAPAFQK